MKSLRFLALLLISAACLALESANAGPPSAPTSFVPPRLVSCPAGDSTFVVTTRHISSDAWSEGPVTIRFCNCPGYRLSHAGTHPYAIGADGCSISLVPDAFGVSRFPIAGGGLCPGDTVWVFAENMWLFIQLPIVASLDQNGDLKVDSADIDIVRSKLGTSDDTADFDGDGVVTDADVAIATAHLGHAAPNAGTPSQAVTWGRVKQLYR